MIIDYSFSKNTEIYSLLSNKKGKRIGKKAESLIALDNYGYNIPNSVFLNYSFYDYYLQNDKLPEKLIEKILSNFANKKLAIRSSCSLEDGINESYAGFFLTKLNITNDAVSIERSIVECYQSLNKLKLYQQEINDEINMGVIIQHMIAPAFSGIIFTAAPENANENIIHIEYCFETGDHLTGSLISSFAVSIDKSDYKIIRQKGNISIPQNLLIKLCKFSMELEKKYKFPQDIEFVIEEQTNKIFLVQSRSITAFNYTPEYIIQQETQKLNSIFETGEKKYNCSPVLTSSNIAELFPTAVPLGYSIFKYIFTGDEKQEGAYNLGRKTLGYATLPKEILSNLFTTVGKNSRMNIQIQALVYRLSQIAEKIYNDMFLPFYLNTVLKFKEKANYPQFGLYFQNPTLDECNVLFKGDGPEIYKIYSQFLDNILTVKIPGLIESMPIILKENDDYYRSQQQHFKEDINGTLILKKSLTKKQLTDLLIRNVEYLRENFGVLYVIIARIAFLCADIIQKLLDRLIPAFPEIFNLKTEFSDQFEKNKEIDFYFNLLLANEEYKGNIEKPNQCRFAFKKSNDIKEFQKLYRHIGPLDLSQPRFGEYKITELQKMLINSETPKKELDLPEKTWFIDFKNWLKDSKEDLSPHFKNMHRWLQYAKEFLEYREIMKSELLKIFYIIKLTVKELSKRYDLNELVYYLTYDDVKELNRNNACRMRLKALKKKAYFNSCSQLEISKIIYKDNPNNILLRERETVDNGIYRQIKGDTIHHGYAEGICLVAHNPDEFHNKIALYREQKIEKIIGVFASVEPAYLNIKVLAGMITEFGGQLAHAATICRENNIPYISSVKTSYFKDGSYIIFDTKKQQIILRE